MEITLLKQIIECAILAAGEPLSLSRLQQLFEPETCPPKEIWQTALAELAEDCQQRGLILQEVASGYCLQIQSQMQHWLQKLWQKRPPRYSRALLETLALIAYRQPLTRAEIEDVRGVAVSSTIMKTLLEREWISIVGHRDVPGKPALYATTRQFLDYFNLKSLSELPPLAELSSLLQQNDKDEITEPTLTNENSIAAIAVEGKENIFSAEKDTEVTEKILTALVAGDESAAEAKKLNPAQETEEIW